MPDVSLNGIEFKIKGSAGEASDSIKKLSADIASLKSALEALGKANKSVGAFKGLADGVKSLHDAFKGGTAKFDKFSEAMSNVAASAELLGENSKHISELANAMATISEVKVTAGAFNSLASGVEKVGKSAQTITKEALDNLDKMVVSLSKLQGVDLQGLGSAMNAVRQAGKMKQVEAPVPLPQNIRDMIESASQIDILEAKLESLRAAMQRAFDAGDQEGAYKFREQILRTEASLEKARDAANKTASALEDVGKAAKKANKPLGNFLNSLKRIAMYRILRSIIKSITQAFQEGLKNAYEFSKATGDQSGLAAALDKIASSSLQMKNQLGAAFGGLIQAVMPIIQDLISAISTLATWISMLFGMFNGSGGYLKAKEVWEDWGDAAEGAGGAAKKALEYLAPFDELNVLPDPKSGGGGGSATDFGSMFEWTEFEEGSAGKKISDFVKENLEAVEAIAHLFEFAVGLIMVCSNPASLLGWGLLVYGGYKLWQDGTVNWDAISTQLQGTLGGIVAIASGALLAIGIILVASGAALPLGIGLIAAGAVGLAATVSANWNTLMEKLRGPIGETVALISGASLLLGILLCVAGMLPLGLGLIAAGAAGLATTIAANWDDLKEIGKTAKEKVKEGWDKVKEKFKMAVQLVKDGWNKVKDWVAEKGQKAGDNVKTAVKLAKEGWKTVSGWVKEGGWGYALKKGIGVAREGWKYISSWIRDSYMGKSVSKGIGIARSGWKYVSTWIKDTWMGKTVYKGIGVMRDGWTSIKNWIGGSYMGDALNKGIGLLRDGWTKVSNWIGGNYMGDKLNQSIGLLRSGWKKISEWIKDNSFIGDAIDVWVNLKRNGWNTVKQWIENLLGIGSLNLAVTSTVSQIGSNSVQSANGVMRSASSPLYSSGFVAVASTNGADGGMTEDLLYRAFSRALADSDLGGDIELDGNTLYKAMVNRNRANTRLTGVNAMA